MRRITLALVVAIVTLAAGGCRDDENRRLAEMAERNLERQAQQEIRNTELQRQVAEGTRRLVESDAAARETIIELHRDVHAERRALSVQLDRLEDDRRAIAAARNRDPVVAESIKVIGLLVACVVPLLIAFQILRRSDTPDESSAVAEIFLNDMVANQPKRVRLIEVNPSEKDSATAGRIMDRRKDGT